MIAVRDFALSLKKTYSYFRLKTIAMFRELFEHVPSEIGAEEAEEVGVEHLLRDIKDTTVGSLSQKITNQLLGLKGLNAQLRDIKNYLIKVRRRKKKPKQLFSTKF